MYEYLVWALMAICGVLTHFCKHLLQARQSDPNLTWLNYWTDHIPQSVLSIVGTIVLFVVAIETGNMNSLMAFACGVMGNSASDIIGKRVSKLGE